MTVQTLSKQAKNRLRWMQHYDKYRSGRLTCRHFGISPSTFYHWRTLYDPTNPASLEDTASRRPRSLRKAKWNYQTLLLLERLKEQNPFIRQKEMRVFLAKQSLLTSAATVSRMIKHLEGMKQRLT